MMRGCFAKPLEQIVKRVASMEAEKGLKTQVPTVGGVGTSSQGDGNGKKWTRGKPRPDNICRKCGGKGHWTRTCPSGIKQKNAVNSTLVRAIKRVLCYYLLGEIANVEVPCLMDPGSQISLLMPIYYNSKLKIEATAVTPVAINQQPIRSKGKVFCQVRLGGLVTKWQFFVVEALHPQLYLE